MIQRSFNIRRNGKGRNGNKQIRLLSIAWIVTLIVIVGWFLFTTTTLSSPWDTAASQWMGYYSGSELLNHPQHRLCTQNPYISAIRLDEDFENDRRSTARINIDEDDDDVNGNRNRKTRILQQVVLKSNTWLKYIQNHYDHVTQIPKSIINAHTHYRFFPFQVMAPCLDSFLECVGGKCGDDDSKIVCGINLLGNGNTIGKQSKAGMSLKDDDNNNCIIYAIGGDNQWDFELDLLDKTPCHIHTFDCTGDISRFQIPTSVKSTGRLHFHHICLSNVYKAKDPTQFDTTTGKCLNKGMCGDAMTLQQIQHHLNHTHIDLLKIDVEGWEWPLLQSWPELSSSSNNDDDNGNNNSNNLALPMQILIEIHYYTQFPELRANAKSLEFKYAEDMIQLQEHILRMGYVVSIRDDNKRCRHCTELTLLRVQCPPATT